MAKATRWVLLGAGVVAAGVGAVCLRAPTDRLVNQVWIERLPRNERDMIWHFVAVEKGDKRGGALGRGSRWRLAVDWFRWKRQGDRIELDTPQTRCRSTLKARVWECAGQAPRPFELCLEMTTGEHVFRYFSRKSWVIKDAPSLPAALSWLPPAADAALALPEASVADDDGATGATCPAVLGP
jgi:hypothetical protein